tara:strand:- start:2399 stop:3334 length:936 start_codon:yes stop_codon:yes gene_type:complete
MPEYHQVKGNTPSLEFFKNPDLAAKAALDAQRILGVDAAILFADLLPMLEPMGLDLDYVPGKGPVFSNPLRTEKDIVQLLNSPAEEATPYIAITISNILEELPRNIALIGFAGAPYTLASYAIEGGGSSNYANVKKLMYESEGVWNLLLNKLTDQLISYLRLQVDAGVDALQIFDTWVGGLSTHDFRRYVLPHIKRLISSIKGEVPIIYFGTGNSHLLQDIMQAEPDVMALDWRQPIDEIWEKLSCTSVQGNLDPLVLCADRATIAEQSQIILDSVGSKPGHIFNLGHGIIPQTPVDNVKFLVDYVHESTS